MTPPRLFRYAYRVDTSVTTPEHVNRLWTAAYGGTSLADAFNVRSASEQQGLGALGRVNDDADWWYEPGGGCSLTDASDPDRDNALLGFFLRHLELFDKLVYGPVESSPNAKDGVWIITARAQEAAAGGDDA